MKLLVLDGNSIFNRAFYGIKLLTTKKGFYTNAIYGFLTMLSKLNEEINPDAVAIAFDMKAPTFRHKAYSEYKANRKGMPEELAAQFPVLKKLLINMGYKLVEKEGYEADDILGTLALACENSGEKCVIATGDRDSLQLVSPNVSVRIAVTKFGKPEVTLYDEEKIQEVYGVVPKQLIDIKAIQGDASDNISGVAGIGEKGAGDLIRKFGSIEYIYDNIDKIDIKDGVKKKLLASKDNAFLSKYLGTIVKNVPIDLNLSGYIPKKINEGEVSKMLSELEMFSLLNKLGLKEVAEKRLAAIKEYTELGSGFKIAMRDLEIRGAGNLLGARQHGHMEAVGYDLYCKMLNEAVKRLKGEKVENDEFETNIDLKMDAFIPADYIPNEFQKLDVYKRIAEIETEPERDDMVDELIDRFGEPPQSVCNLLEIALLKARAHDAYITAIVEKANQIRITMFPQAKVATDKIPDLLAAYQGKLRFVPETTPYFVYQQKEEPLLRQLSELVNEMQKIKEEENE